MKKSLFIVSLLCLSVAVFAAEEKEDVKGAHPYKVAENEEGVAEEFAHWSLTPHVGFNYFDGDFNSEMQHAIAIPNAGLDLEYSFNPVWGLGVNYMYDMYNVTGKPGFDNADTLLTGHMHKTSLYVSMDFMNLFYPRAKKKIFSANAIVGGGYAWYKSTKLFYDSQAEPTWTRGHTAGYINEDGVNAPSYMTGYKGQLFLFAGLGLEFNLNRTIALGVRATYNYFINDYIDGRGYAGPNAPASKNNDGIVDVTLNMRFKLMAVSKTHMRNLSNPDVWKKEEAVAGPQYIHDTLILKHDSIIIRETIKQVRQKEQQRAYYIYFNSGKSNLDDKALITIQQVADVLAEDSTLYAVVTGYCDNTGTAALNYALGDKRAENVIDELREEHQVDAEHMYAMGLGKLVGHRSQAAYGPNRRAVIRLVDKRTFEKMKNDLDDKRANRIIEEDTKAVEKAPIPLSESAQPISVNEYAQRGSEDIITEKGMTLSKLARRYYNNTYCWVYIYMANKSKIPNPNSLESGITLSIPELTQQEMRITKDQSLVLYGAARQIKQ